MFKWVDGVDRSWGSDGVGEAAAEDFGRGRGNGRWRLHGGIAAVAGMEVAIGHGAIGYWRKGWWSWSAC